jgi:hypothetical protein
MKKLIVSFLFCLCISFVAGCVTVSKYANAKYSPTDANKIEVYSTSVPKKEYVELAKISYSLGRDTEKLKEEAAKLGADAIILTEDTTAKHTDVSSERPRGGCVAIKFK